MASEYSEKLRDPRWQKKRLQILERDEWVCQSCSDPGSTLVVHHRDYLKGGDPWDCPDNLLITLCENCHEIERSTRHEYEELLLKQLRINFFSDDLRRLALGLSKLKLLHASEVVASVYEWAFSNPSIQQQLIDKFFIYLDEQIRTK